MKDIYDVIIIGGGPAGLSAGLYSGRAKMSTLIIEKDKEGGQIVQTAEIDNYPGGLDDESGPTLIDRMSAQATKFDVERTLDTVEKVEFNGKEKVITCKNNTYKAKTVIIATGATPVPISCQGEQEFLGKGVSYCATCDAAFFEDFEVYVVGGGDSAIQEALYLTKFARKVTIIHRRDQLRAAKSLQEKALEHEKIDFLWDSVVEEVKGEGLLEKILVKNVKTGEVKEVCADDEDGTFGLFVFIGLKPQSEVFEGILDLEDGYIRTDDNMKTNIDGVFAAGDIRVKSLRQVVTAAADGAIAAVQAEQYIENAE